jgi:hypothetical protein
MALAETLGLEGFIGAGRDVQILLAQKFLRMLAYGQTALILVTFFLRTRSQGINDRHVHVTDTARRCSAVVCRDFLCR